MLTVTRMAAWGAALLLVPAFMPSGAQAQEDEDDSSVILAQDDSAEPPTAAPAETPPPPAPAPPPPRVERPAASPAASAGQWVYTRQYGWVWAPYADAYTYVPPDGFGEPCEYVYYPTVGWTWVVAPWIWGWGPWPTFGLYGPAYFGWYGHGWWRTPHRWHYAAVTRGGGWNRSGGVIRPGANRPGGARPGAIRPSFGGRAGGPGVAPRASVVGGHSGGGHPGGASVGGGGRPGGHSR